MPFLTPNQQRQSTEGKSLLITINNKVIFAPFSTTEQTKSIQSVTPAEKIPKIHFSQKIRLVKQMLKAVATVTTVVITVLQIIRTAE